MKWKKFFSLMELLIVVAVIVILAGLLLPALNAARDKAYGVSCVNNLKTIGNAGVMYQNDYQDYFPPSYGGSFSGDCFRTYEFYLFPYMTSAKLEDSVPGYHDLLRKDQTKFRCPSDRIVREVTNRAVRSYAENYYLGDCGTSTIPRTPLKSPAIKKTLSLIPFVAEGHSAKGYMGSGYGMSIRHTSCNEWFANGWTTSPTPFYHGKYAAVSFVDAHVQMIPAHSVTLASSREIIWNPL